MIDHIFTLGYTTSDDGVHLDCSCGWNKNLGFEADGVVAMAAQEQHKEESKPTLTPPRAGALTTKEDAERIALELLVSGEAQWAWVVPEYGNDMGHENVLWGHRVWFFEPVVATA